MQCAIQEIIEDMLAGLLDYKKAALALYGLQTAASNLKQMRLAEHERRQAEDEQQRNAERTPRSQRDVDSFGGGRLQPVRAGAENNPASAAEVRLAPDETEEVERNGANSRGETTAAHDDKLETNLPSASPASSCVHLPQTGDQQPTTPLIESPRPPQHVRFGLTADEREHMNHRFPDLKKIRAEMLASLTPEERALVEAGASAPSKTRVQQDQTRTGT